MSLIGECIKLMEKYEKEYMNGYAKKALVLSELSKHPEFQEYYDFINEFIDVAIQINKGVIKFNKKSKIFCCI